MASSCYAFILPPAAHVGSFRFYALLIETGETTADVLGASLHPGLFTSLKLERSYNEKDCDRSTYALTEFSLTKKIPRGAGGANALLNEV